jgi:hypothetical protein
VPRTLDDVRRKRCRVGTAGACQAVAVRRRLCLATVSHASAIRLATTTSKTNSPTKMSFTAYQQRDRWLFRTTRGMWEGPDAGQLRRIVLGIMHEGTPEAVILHASLTSAQRHSIGPSSAGGEHDG